MMALSLQQRVKDRYPGTKRKGDQAPQKQGLMAMEAQAEEMSKN